MIYLVRLVAFLTYWIGSRFEFIIKILNGIRRQKIPEFKSEILALPAVQLVQKLKNCELSSEELLREYIKRIEEVNPIVNAVVEDRFLNALEDAKKVDQAIMLAPDKEELFQKYPLLGIPFSVKESCAVKGLSHVVGSYYREGLKAKEDGASIAIFKKAGAIPLLVSANPELCVSWETYSTTYGRCLNPYNTVYSTGGSSGGEGALNGSGATVFGIGSDFCGSIRIPAMFNGVYGYKPSGEIVSAKGHFPNTEQVGMGKYLQMGPITRFLEDLPLLLNVIADKNVSKLLDATDMDKMKIFYVDLTIWNTVLPVTNSIKKSIDDACKYFSSIGNEVQKLEIEELNDIMEILIARLTTFKAPPILDNPFNPEQKTTALREVLKYLIGKPRHTLQALHFQLLLDINEKEYLFYKKYYLKQEVKLEMKLKTALGNDGVLFFPTFHREAFLHNTSFSHCSGVIIPGIFNVMGLPCLHIPTGFDKKGLPTGFQIIAGPYADKNCFKVAEELKKVFGGWVPPL